MPAAASSGNANSVTSTNFTGYRNSPKNGSNRRSHVNKYPWSPNASSMLKISIPPSSQTRRLRPRHTAITARNTAPMPA